VEEFNILDRIAFTSSTNEKLKTLKDNVSNERLADLLDATYNFHRKYHIHKFDMPNAVSDLHKADVHANFLYVISQLENREVTGNDARSLVESFFCVCTHKQQQWYSKVLNKDLKIGISAKTIKKAGFDIPLFELMLATDGAKCPNINKIVPQGVYISPKLDGYRCLAVCTGSSVTLYTRKGTEYHNFPFDGEIMSDDFQAMQKSAFADKRGTTVGDVKFHVFDQIPYDEWVGQKFKTQKWERMNMLNAYSNNFDNNILLVDQQKVDNLDDIIRIRNQFQQQGYEGAMTIPANCPYYVGRKGCRLLKFKTMQSQDCTVIGFYEGTEGTRNEGRLGGLVLLQEDGTTRCDCGTGFSDKDRDYIWTNQAEFLNNKVEIKYQELTKDGVMRFPVFERWRIDK
jgi:DNA ligase-1